MKRIFQQLILAFGLGCAAVSAQAVSYICKTDGGIIFSEKKIKGSQCEESHTDGSAQVSAEDAANALPEKVNLKEVPGSAAPEVSDIKILPQASFGSVTNSADAANTRMNVKLRNSNANSVLSGGKTNISDLKSAQARADELNRKAKIIPAPVINAPTTKPKPQLTRKQILQNEVRNEQAALARAKAQLNVARKKGDQAKISRLSQAVSDREANIRAIQGEMSR